MSALRFGKRAALDADWPSLCIHGNTIGKEGKTEWCPECRKLGCTHHEVKIEAHGTVCANCGKLIIPIVDELNA